MATTRRRRSAHSDSTPVGPKAIVRTSLLDFTEGTAICLDVPHSFLIQVNCASSLCVLAMMAPHEWARSPNEYMHLHLASTKFPDSTPGEVGATEVEGAARVVEASRPDDSGVHPPRVALPCVLPGSAGAVSLGADYDVHVRGRTMDGPLGQTAGGR